MISFSGIYLKLAHFPIKIGLIQGVGGVPKIWFIIGIFLLILLGSPLKDSEPFNKPFWDIFEISPFSDQNRVNSQGRGGPRIFFFQLESYYLCYLGAHTQILNPISLSGIYLKIAHFLVKIGLIRGVGGVPEIRFYWNPPLFVT